MAKPLRILLVDDDPTILELLDAFLSGKGYEVQSCASGQEGLEALAESPADLVVSDIAMAGMNGFEFVRAVRENYSGIGIILMTAYDDVYPLSEALRAGADGYITKPFNLKKFSLIFEQAYWTALCRPDWWAAHAEAAGAGEL